MGSETQGPHQVCIKTTSFKFKKQRVCAGSVPPTSVDVLESFFVDLAAALFSAVDIWRPAFDRLQLRTCARSLQLPLGHEVPREAVFCVITLQAAKQWKGSKNITAEGGTGKVSQWKLETRCLLLQNELLEILGEIKDGCNVQKWDDKLGFCWTEEGRKRAFGTSELI